MDKSRIDTNCVQNPKIRRIIIVITEEMVVVIESRKEGWR